MVKYDNQGLAKEAFHYSSLGVQINSRAGLEARE